MHIQPDVEMQPQDSVQAQVSQRGRQLFGERSTSESEDDALPEKIAQLAKSASEKKKDKGKGKQQDPQAVLDTSEEDDAAYEKEQREVRSIASLSAVLSHVSLSFDSRKRKSQMGKDSRAATLERALHVVERIAKVEAEFSTANISQRMRTPVKQKPLRPAKSLLHRNATSLKLPLPIHQRRTSSTSPRNNFLPIASIPLTSR